MQGVGSRNAPDCIAPRAEPVNDDKRAEMKWLCDLIGCVPPSPFADAATAASAASSPSPLPLPLRVSLRDGRVYVGRLHCIDSSLNLLLASATLLRGVRDGVAFGGFGVGSVLIAWKHVLRVEQQRTD